jgi:outer membrane protein assembly factor BamB
MTTTWVWTMIWSVVVLAQDPPRYTYGAKLEPPAGRIVHGMGQWEQYNAKLLKQYFAIIAERPEIKWFHLIGYDWSRASYFAQTGWKNNDFTASLVLPQKLVAELQTPRYLHASDKALLRGDGQPAVAASAPTGDKAASARKATAPTARKRTRAPRRTATEPNQVAASKPVESAKPDEPVALPAASPSAAIASPSPQPETCDVPAGDWPMWRHDAARTAASPSPLPEELHLHWVRDLPEPAPAWRHEHYKLQFDRSYEPVVMGRQVFVPSMVSDKVAAYDTATGRENWQFFCDGPVRFAPIACQGRVYFVSDDGFLYCLDAKEGQLQWKAPLAPDGRKILGNGRLISAWPARGGPVLQDGKIYCAASIWPFMGVFIYAIDAATGKVVWENSGTGANYMVQPHNSPAFAGVAPQGYMAISNGKLLVTSRTVPACFDAGTGELLYYRLSDNSYGKTVGGCSASIWNDWYFNGKVAYRLSDGLPLGTISGQVMTRNAVVGIDSTGEVLAYTLAETEAPDPKDKKKTKTVAVAKATWKTRTEPVLERIHLQAGDRLYGCDAQGGVAAFVAPESNEPARIVWQDKVEGRVWSMLAGDERLFVVTEEGQLYCFGAGKTEVRRHRVEAADLPAAPAEQGERIRRVLKQSPGAQGYCLWLGTGDGSLLREMLRQSSLYVMALEPDAARVASLRHELDRAGLYGARACVLQGNLDSITVPPYIASWIVVENPVVAGLDGSQGAAQKLCALLRPYTGIAWAATGGGASIGKIDMAGFQVDTPDGTLLVRRTGPVPGSADWTHQYGDVANTVCSKDQLAPPLGLLWFGEEAALADVLPRHGHGPPEQVVDGRLFIQGPNSLSARDVYTGKILWKKTLPGLGGFGVYYDATYKHDFRDTSGNQRHIPGANVRGTNFVATADRVYVIQDAECHVLDARTGEMRQVIRLPAPEGTPPKAWGYIGVCDDCLIAGADFAQYAIGTSADSKDVAHAMTVFDKSAARRLVVMNRYTGQVLWTIEAQRGFLHNAIAAGKGKLFCLDIAPPYAARKPAQTAGSGRKSADPNHPAETKPSSPPPPDRLLALDLHSGKILWENRDGVFGSWLAYSQEFDILLQAYRKSRDMPTEPGDRMAALQGATGAVLWDKKITYTGPCMLLGETILTQESAYHLHTGQQQMREHPLTNEPAPWKYSRNYGCGTAIASQNLITFRSAAAGFYDLTSDAGTGNFGGFRSSCTSNLVVANGVLNAPDYTKTCTCSYQNQTSLALIHMPDVEMWSFSDLGASQASVRNVGVNFGAPGDRRADNGTLWLEYPGVGGSSPKLDLTVTPEKFSCFRRHSLRLQAGVLPWVEASGARGLRSIRIRLAQGVPTNYTVSLHFVEPDAKQPGERVFDVSIGTRTVLKGLDIVAEAKAPQVGIVKTFPGIPVSEWLEISLTPADPKTETILCGIEIRAEK